MPADVLWPRAWWISTAICGNRAVKRLRPSRRRPCAAALGGFTAVSGHAQHRAGDRQRRDRSPGPRLSGRSAPAEVAVAGAITVGRAGDRLAPMAELAELGVRLFTDDGTGVQDGALMRRALEYARGLG